MDRLNLLFPVETINRELDFRIFLGAMASNKNNRIFIGQHNAIDRLTKHTEGGIYLGKNVFKGLFPSVEATTYLDLKKRKYRLIHLDEEGAVYLGNEDNWKRVLMSRINPNYLAAEDYICTWGEYQSDFYKEREPACQDNIYPTGHPRFDLYKPKYRDFFAKESNELKKKHGDFILINSQLSIGNSGLGLADTFSKRLNFNPKNVETRTRWIKYWSHTTQVLALLVELINRLNAKFPKQKIIIRPHPSENWDFYKTIFRDYENIEVLHEGPVAHWLLACKVLIHDSCTTSIEAHLADTPVVTYKSIPKPAHDIFLCDEVGSKCFTEDEVVEQVKAVFENKYKPNRNLKPMVSKLMANFEEDCFENMLKVISEVEDKLHREKTSFKWDKNRFKSAEKAHQMKGKAKSVVRPFFPEKQEQFKFFRDNHFYGFKKYSIESKINLVQNVLNKEINYEIFNDELLMFEIK